MLNSLPKKTRSVVNEVTMKLLSREITKDHPILVSEENGSMKVSNIEE